MEAEGPPAAPPTGGAVLKSTVVVSPPSPVRAATPAPAPVAAAPAAVAAPMPIASASSGARPAQGGEPLRRPDDEVDLVYRVEAAIEAGSLVAPGDDDFFLGYLDEAVAFVLLGARRVVPEACQGAFVARNARLLEVDVEVGAFADAQQREARVALRGSLAVRVIDPIGFVQGDVPHTASELGDLVVDNVVAELRTRLESSLESGTLTVADLAEGMDGESLGEILGEIVAGLDLAGLYGVSAWFDQPTLAADVDGLEGAEGGAGTDSAADATHHDQHVLARSGDEDALLEVVEGPCEAGMPLTVGEGEVFVSVVDGRAMPPLGAGRYRLPNAIERGLFLRRVPTPERVGGSLGQVADAAGVRGEVRVTAVVRITVGDAAAFSSALVAAMGQAGGAPEPILRARVLETIGARLREALAQGALHLASLAEASTVLGGGEMHTPELPGAAIELEEIELVAALEPVEAPPPVHAPEPALAPAPEPAPISAGANVLVAWPDGNRYPATVQQTEQGQAYVIFPDGQQGWVTFDRLTRA
jgi:hypothetical protein